jgi:hypothetical protein
MNPGSEVKACSKRFDHALTSGETRFKPVCLIQVAWLKCDEIPSTPLGREVMAE